MLDLRVYRAAFVPLLVAVLVAAFSLESLPRPVTTTLAPDAFDGPAAFETLGRFVEQFGDRRPGSAGDARLADLVARDLGVLGPGAVRRTTTSGQTIEGEEPLETITATRPGAPGPGIVVVAHRDAAGPGAAAELSGTVALLELARVAAGGNLERTITFVSTSGGSGGLAAARAAAARLDDPVDAVLVLGDLASRNLRKPWVVGWSNANGVAPLRLQRTVASAVRGETGQDPGGPRAGAQWARLAFPATLSEQGAFLAEGLPAVLLSATGERPPAAGAPVAEQRMEVFGRAALRTILALDAGPDLAAGPEARLVIRRKILPEWALRLLVAAALLPLWVAALDGAARVRRRRLSVRRALRWVLATTAPFAATAALLVAIGRVGLLAATPAAPVPAGALDPNAAGTAIVVVLGLVFALAWLVLRPALLGTEGRRDGYDDAHAAAALLVVAVLSGVVWIVNPWAAALLVLPAHAALLTVAPEIRLARWAPVAIGTAALLPALLAGVSLAGQLGYGPVDTVWAAVLAVAGGHVGPAALVVWAMLGGSAVSVGLLAARHAPNASDTERATVRGPRSYAGPGSLGGTDSALRR